MLLTPKIKFQAFHLSFKGENKIFSLKKFVHYIFTENVVNIWKLQLTEFALVCLSNHYTWTFINLFNAIKTECFYGFNNYKVMLMSSACPFSLLLLPLLFSEFIKILYLVWNLLLSCHLDMHHILMVPKNLQSHVFYFFLI